MLLLITNRGDHTADWVVAELHRRGEPFVRFNTEDYPARTGFQVDPSGALALSIGGDALDLSTVTSVWYRRPAPPNIAPGDSARREWEEAESRHALRALWRLVHAQWVNHPDDNDRASSKPEQLSRAARRGFLVPNTLLTNLPAEARAFVATMPEGAICKPLSSGHVPTDDQPKLFFTTRLNDHLLAHLRHLGPTPLLFQEHIPKRYDVRVTVIGDSVFATRIDSQDAVDATVDWRRAPPGALRHRPERLPDEVAILCRDLVRDYGLKFGAIDLARTVDGGYCFFELNPNGQWAWIEQLTHVPLRARLVDLLVVGE